MMRKLLAIILALVVLNAQAYQIFLGTGKTADAVANVDHYGVERYNAPNGEAVSVPLYKLIGDSFSGDTLDPNLWTSTLGTGGSAVVAGGEVTVSTGTTANNSAEISSVGIARFSGMAPNKFKGTLQLPDAGTAGSTPHWGLWTATDGVTFEQAGTIFRLVTRKGGVDTVVADGSLTKPFNGQYGPTFTPGIVDHFYEIIYQPRQVVWLADNKIIHTLNSNITTWSGTLHLPIHFGITNSGGSTKNASLKMRMASVVRFGIPQTQPYSAFIVGLNAGTNLKNTPGNLKGITISAVTNNAVVTLYNNTTATGTILWSSGPLPANAVPIPIPMYDIPYSVGLSISITGAAASAFIAYE